MEDKNIEYLDNFEAHLLEDMIRVCTSFGMLDGTLLESDDINAKWKEFAPEYMADAVPNINDFPEAQNGGTRTGAGITMQPISRFTENAVSTTWTTTS